jgi:hypothetical protein
LGGPGDTGIDNRATERTNRDIALGRGNWTFFGGDNGGKTVAVFLSFIAMCKRNALDSSAWIRDVLTRIASHPIRRIEELLPHVWKILSPPLKPEIRRPSLGFGRPSARWSAYSKGPNQVDKRMARPGTLSLNFSHS